jgi:ParB-like chromosome segregation protein Spo0J
MAVRKKATSRANTPAPVREWPADKTERWAIEKLIPYAKNARTHSDAQVAQIAASMKEWGWTNPVLADEAGGLISGHGRVLAARQLGIAEVPVMVARGWTEAQKRAYVIADNKLALNAGWDDDLLRFELGELQLGGFDLSLTGFGDLELKDILAGRTEGLTDPDDAPPVPEHPVTRTGDLWLLGAKVTCRHCRKVPAVYALRARIAIRPSLRRRSCLACHAPAQIRQSRMPPRSP